MKPLSKALSLITAITVISSALFAFSSSKKILRSNSTSYAISLVSIETVNGNIAWTWTLTNTNPGNGRNGTLQDVSHWSIPLCPAAEASLVSAEYSYDGINWIFSSISIDRDPSIRLCTRDGVLKFDAGTSGIAPTYYRATFNKAFNIDPYASSYIKTGGGLQGCNVYSYTGVGCTEPVGEIRKD